MPPDSANGTGLFVIAVAVVVQAITLVAIAVGSFVAWRRMQTQLDLRYRALAVRLDEVMPPMRRAAEAVERVSDHASRAMGRADHVAGAVNAALGVPRSLLALGAATVASLILRRWPRPRPMPAARQAPEGHAPRAIH